MMSRNSFNNQSNKSSEQYYSNSPNKDLVADNDTTQIYILLLLLSVGPNNKLGCVCV